MTALGKTPQSNANGHRWSTAAKWAAGFGAGIIGAGAAYYSHKQITQAIDATSAADLRGNAFKRVPQKRRQVDHGEWAALESLPKKTHLDEYMQSL